MTFSDAYFHPNRRNHASTMEGNIVITVEGTTVYVGVWVGVGVCGCTFSLSLSLFASVKQTQSQQQSTDKKPK